MMKASVSITKGTPEADADVGSTPTPAQVPPAEPEESTLDVADIHRQRKRRSKSGSGDAGAGGSSRKKGTTHCVNMNSKVRLEEMELEKQGFEVKDGKLYCVACNVFSASVFVPKVQGRPCGASSGCLRRGDSVLS